MDYIPEILQEYDFAICVIFKSFYFIFPGIWNVPPSYHILAVYHGYAFPKRFYKDIHYIVKKP